jgi:hypothetical protein
MAIPRIVIGDPAPERLGLLEPLVRQLGYEPVRLRRGMRGNPPAADALLLERSFELGRDLIASLRRRNPGLPVVYLEKPFSLERLRRRLDEAVSGRGVGQVLVSVTRR